MSSKRSTNLHNKLKLERARASAKHGDFFFASWVTSDGYVRESPCFVVSDHSDPYNEILVLKCSSQPSVTNFDVKVTCLKLPSIVRTNKIYTIQRSQLLIPLKTNLDPLEYVSIIDGLKNSLNIN